MIDAIIKFLAYGFGGYLALMAVLLTVTGIYIVLKDKWMRRDPERYAAYLKQEREKSEQERLNNRIVGRLYLITDKDLTHPQVWLTEEEGPPVQLFSKFGWVHSRRGHSGSLSHEMYYLAENVLFDKDYQRHFNPDDYAGDQRRIRLIRYDAIKLSPDVFRLYVIIDRVEKKVTTRFVSGYWANQFLATVGEHEFRRAHLAATNIQFPLGYENDPKIVAKIYRGEPSVQELGPSL